MSQEKAKKEDIGTIIQEARIINGYTFAQLAERSGISSSYIQKLESGDRKAPPAAAIMALCDSLGLDFEEVLAQINGEHVKK